MRLKVVQYISSVFEVAKSKKTLRVAPFDTGAGKIPLSIIQAAGDLIVGLAAGSAGRLAGPSLSDIGKVLTVIGAGQWGIVDIVGGVAEVATCNARLTLETGVAISTTDQTAKTVVYLTPYLGNRISLFDGVGWNRRVLTEKSIKLTDTQTGTLTNGNTSVTGLSDTSQLIVGMEVSGTGIAGGTTIATIPSSTSITLSANATDSGAKTLTFKVAAGKNLDIFCFDNSSTPKLEMTAWTNDTARATALTLQDGVLVKTGATTRRYIGTVRTTATAGQTEITFGATPASGGSAPKMYLYNEYNKVKTAFKTAESTDTWAYNTTAWRLKNNSDGNSFKFVSGNSLFVSCLGIGTCNALTTETPGVGFGYDSAAAASGLPIVVRIDVNNKTNNGNFYYAVNSQASYHYIAELEYGQPNAVFMGDGGIPAINQSGAIYITEM